ncbi:MAG TPA: trehalose-phosphatase [Alphaproteobacteria bacterium]|nr:trehalose-phosphatase [Alphaproteobacteria bacterium]
MQSLPLPAAGDRWCLFLDFDGTLAEIAPAPHLVEIDPALPELLMRLSGQLDGALAIITGRPLDDLDALLAPAALTAAGQHGLEKRDSAGRIHTPQTSVGVQSLVESEFNPLVAAEPRLVFENKTHSFSLHYRQAPEQEQACRAAVARLLPQLEGYHLLDGKKVLEIKPCFANKGHAIADFLNDPVFSGRTPVFAGDDVTDEDGFAVINAQGGISIKVGTGPSAATHRVQSEAALINWLHAVAEVLAGQADK